ncbi:hypothetical protein VKT23_000184 [Stygiomarasmius scandens]|uniref:Uncharacterized protein n=1 Tax=Marasmiellus scandens TaxID=2682957 RepID=A0ABR1K6T9_9AGAR
MIPDDGLPEVESFWEADLWNEQVVSNSSFYNTVVDHVMIKNSDPAKWFYGAGGSALVALGIMSLIRQSSRDKYETSQIMSRILLGLAIISISAIDVHASKGLLDEEFRYQGSGIWWLVVHYLVLPPYALALLVEQAIELLLLHLAGRNLGLSMPSLFKLRCRASKNPDIIEDQESKERLIVKREEDQKKGEISLRRVKSLPSILV